MHRQRGALRLWQIAALTFVALIALPFPQTVFASPSARPRVLPGSPATADGAMNNAAAVTSTPEGKTSPSIPLPMEGGSRKLPSLAKGVAPQARGDALHRSDDADKRVAAAQTEPPGNPLAFLASELPQPGAPREVLLEVHINGQDGYGDATLMSLDTDPNKSLYATASELKHWRLLQPDIEPREYAGDKYYPLRAIPGLDYHVDNSTATLWITVPAKDFTGTNIVGGPLAKNPMPQATPPGGFLNYDFFATRDPTAGTTVNGLFEAGVFNNWGVGTSQFLAQNVGRAHSHLIRLETVWIRDNPADMTSLQVGDSFSHGGMTGLSVLMGGVQFGTDFSTRPYFLTFPLPALAGETATPSTLQLYLNGKLSKTEQVPPGQFLMPVVPIQTNPANIELVVRDALGRQQIITTSFYASSQLLKTGLNDYSFNFGKLRENFGLGSNDYGPLAATGLFRHGFSDRFTGEVRGEASENVQDFGLGAAYADILTGELDGAVAVSHSRLGQGALGRLVWRRQWRVFNLGGSVQLASPRFTELGYNGQPAPRRQITASVGGSFGPAGSASLLYLDQDNLGTRTRLLSTNYSISIGKSGFLSLNVFHALGGASNNGLSLSFSMPFGERSTANFGITRQNGVARAFAQVQQSLPAGTGFGYKAGAELGPTPDTQAEFDYQNDVGTWRVGAQNVGGRTSYQAEASGGLAFAASDFFASRRIDDAFGVVQVPGLANVTIYSQNQPVAITDSKGYALIPRLLPYQNNPLSLSAEDLPLSTQIGSLQVNAVPRYRSAAFVKFPVSNNRGATLTIKLEDGKPLPAGATVQIVGDKQTFPVGLDGELYIIGLSAHNELEANWNQQHCRIVVDMPETKDPLPDLGTFTCKGIELQ